MERCSHGDAHEKKRKKNPSSYCRECAGQKTPILGDILRIFFLFKVYNQTLRKLGDNDFRVEHTGVGKRQRDGTLETMVKYDAEAFSAAWDDLADSDKED